MKAQILFVLHLPPPVHGASMVGTFIRDSKRINETFNTRYVNLSTSGNLQEIGTGGLGKWLKLFKILFSVCKVLITRKTGLCYLTLTAKGPGFYKDLFIVALLKLFRKKIIYHLHNKGVQQFSQSSINRLLYRFCFHKTRVILLSPLLYPDISKFIQEKNIFYCANGIPAQPQKNDLIDKQNKIFTLLFLSNMMEEKGVYILLEACRILKEKNFSFRCNFVGAWSDITEDCFNERVKEYDLINEVKAFGKKYGQNKQHFFETADAFVFPTFYHNECFPLTLLEAMQNQLPVISTDEGAIREIITPETGILVQKKDPDSLAETIEFLILNPANARAMGMEGKKRFEEHFTLSIMEDNLVKILQKTLENK